MTCLYLVGDLDPTLDPSDLWLGLLPVLMPVLLPVLLAVMQLDLLGDLMEGGPVRDSSLSLLTSTLLLPLLSMCTTPTFR